MGVVLVFEALAPILEVRRRLVAQLDGRVEVLGARDGAEGIDLRAGDRELVLDQRRLAQGRQYDVDPDGQRFLMMLDAAAGDGGAVLRRQINVVLNWFEELNARVPVN